MRKLIPLFAVTIILWSCNGPDTSSPKAVVNSFLTAMKKGDIEAVKKTISKKDVTLMEAVTKFSSFFGKDASEKFKQELMDKAKDASFTIKDEKINGDNATVDVEIAQKGETHTMSYDVIKEDGSWKVSINPMNGLIKNVTTSDPGNNDPSDSDNAKEKMKQLLESGYKDLNMDSLKEEIQKHKGAIDSVANMLKDLKF